MLAQTYAASRNYSNDRITPQTTRNVSCAIFTQSIVLTLFSEMHNDSISQTLIKSGLRSAG